MRRQGSQRGIRKKNPAEKGGAEEGQSKRQVCRQKAVTDRVRPPHCLQEYRMQ